MFFSCTVVSTLTRARSAGLTNPLRRPVRIVSASISSTPASLRYARHFVIDEESIGGVCSKNTPPQKYCQ